MRREAESEGGDGTMRATKQQVKTYQLNLAGGADEAEQEKKKRRKEEAMHQAALMAHCRVKLATYPNLEYLFATLNGIFMPPHIRAQAVEAGLAPGILDLWYPVRQEPYAGLVMELKKLKDGRPSTKQKQWAAHLSKQGFLVVFPAGCVEAWRVLCCYEGIVGADHIARELVAQEDGIRRMCEVEGASEWER